MSSSNPRVYDCFTFFNELDLLSVRLEYLSPVVDFFVIVEANYTHQGKQKEFLFESNKELFSKYASKIKYVQVYEQPDIAASPADKEGNKWLLENFQRDQVLQGLTDAKDDDIILLSDLDEIPSITIIESYIKRCESNIWVAEMYMMYYFANCLNVTEPIWRSGTRIGRFSTVKEPNQQLPAKSYYQYSGYGKPTYFRFCKGELFKNGGWHFSYLGSAENIKTKLVSIAEQHLDNKASINEIEKRIKNNEDILGRNNYKYITFHPKKFLSDEISLILNNFPQFIAQKSLAFYFWSELRYFLYRLKSKLN